MNRLTVINSPNITCNFTRDDWQLFDMEGVGQVVKDLNFQLESFVNAGYSKREVRKLMRQDLATYKDYGACDSEPLNLLDDALDEIFGEL